MLNAIVTKNSQIALLHYSASDFTILRAGDYVVCAQSGEKIELEDLIYWSVEYQEAYKDALSFHKRAQQRAAL